MTYPLRFLATMLGLLVGLAVVSHAGARAPSASGEAPLLTIDPVPASVVGDRPVVIAHLVEADGTPVADATLSLSIGNTVESRGRTVENGSAVLLVKSYLDAGTYTAKVTFNGETARDIAAASATTPLEVSPGSIAVQMVPAMAGVEVRLTPLPDPDATDADVQEAVTLFTDDEGMANFDIASTGMYRLELVLPWASPDPDVSAEFSRWMDNVFEPSREIDYHNGDLYQAGFELHYLISYQFTDLQGNPIDPSEITSITIKNSMGERITRETHEPLWIKGGRVTRRTAGLEETQLIYSVEQVIVDGTNVVNRAQLSFVPAETRSWTLPLLYYSMSFSSVDALFGFPVGKSVEVVSPGGQVRTLSLDDSGQAKLPLLPRGEYQVRILGGGYSPATPVMLSRDQAVQLKVISVWDGAFVGGLGLIVALGLLAVGRWRWSRVRRRSSPGQLVTQSSHRWGATP